jgi:uncharacterized protein (TIGR04255 family)
MIFANPPLVELIAELRWLPGGVEVPAPVPGAMVQFPIVPSHVEESFAKFLNQVAVQGFGMAERILPPGFPLLPFSVMYRVRKISAEDQNFLYQIGPGIFSANALPPYRSWETFKPIVEQGVRALLESRHIAERGDFTAVSLRYIDLFSDQFSVGKLSFAFLNEVLGIKVALPRALIEQMGDMSSAKSGLQLSVPLRTGLTMNLNIQDGTAAGKNGIVMVTEVISTLPIAANLQAIMRVLENAHGSIRATFLSLTERLNDKMQPVQ